MIAKDEIDMLKEMLLEEYRGIKKRLEDNREHFQQNSESDSTGELSLYDNHPADTGTELFEREKDMALDRHADTEIDKIEQALQAIEMGTYGMCQVCGKELDLERLKAVPTTLTCKNHSNEQTIPHDRPVEEEIIQLPIDQSFLKHSPEITDDRDSFQDVAQFGTSETPSDFEGDYWNYGELYNRMDNEKKGFVESYELFIGTNIEGEDYNVFPSRTEEEYETLLDERKADSQFGDIPYKSTDGYVEQDE